MFANVKVVIAIRNTFDGQRLAHAVQTITKNVNINCIHLAFFKILQQKLQLTDTHTIHLLLHNALHADDVQIHIDP
jgi:recombinational DNA repair protein RecR